MKTLKTLFAISAILLVSGYSYANGKGPGDSENASLSVREKIATAIESADIKSSGEVTLKFGINGKKYLQILNVESSDKTLTKEVREALSSSRIRFPQGTEGVYQIKVRVNEIKETNNENLIRDQLLYAVSNIEAGKTESVYVKVRVVHPNYVKVLKTETNNPKLAAKVKEAVEKERLYVPKNLNGDYNVKVTFKQ